MKIHIIILFLAAIGLISCQSTTNQEEKEETHEHGEEGVLTLNKKQQEALNLELGAFEMRNLTTVVKANGELEVAPGSRAGVTALIGGNVKAIKVFIGDKVKKGQVLAILEHPDYIQLQEDFAVIAHQLEFLEKEYNRQKELYDNNIGAGKDYQKAQADYHTAEVKYQSLKSRLLLLHLSPEKVKNGNISNTIEIVSPISGYVNQVNIKVGIYVDSKRELFEIADNSAIHADFMVYEKDVHLLKEGQKLHFTVANKEGKEYSASIFAIGKEFDKKTRAIHIHARINDKTEGLIPGMYITGHLHTDEHYVKTLPKEAVVVEGTKAFIFIVEQEHPHEVAEENHTHEHQQNEQTLHSENLSFKMMEVITGKSDEGYIEIRLLSDLPKDTKIVMNAAYYLLSDLQKEETEHEH